MSTPTTPYLNVGPYQKVINGISTVFAFSDGVAKLTGSQGAGKTAALRELVRELRNEEFEVVEYAEPPRSPDDLQASLIRQFRLGADVSFRKALLRHFASRPRDQQRLFLVFDNAEHFSVATLQALHSLREIDNNGLPLISLLLCGNKTLNALLNHPDLAALQGDINLAYSLGPLDDDELSEFCSAWLLQQGKGRLLLSLEFLAFLQEQTHGLPAAVLQQLELAVQDPQFSTLHTRREAPAASDNPAMLGQVIHNITEQLNNIPPETKRWLKPTAAVLFTAAAASTVYTYYPPVLLLYRDLFSSQPTSAPVATLAEPTVTAPAPVNEPVASELAATVPSAAGVTTPAEPTITATTVGETPPAVAAAGTTTPTAASTSADPAAPPLPAAPPAAPVAGSDTEQVVLNWAQAWRSQNTDAYLGFYHTDFAPLYHPSRSNWREDRTRSVSRPASIELVVRDMAIAGADPTGTSVRFWLDYRSPTYADSTLKELVIGRDLDGELRILRELNREVVKGGTFAAAPPTPAPPVSAASGSVATQATATPIGAPIVVSAEPQLSTLQNGRDSINEFIGSWLSAWQHQDVEGYFRHYQSNFVGPAMDNNAQWRSDRTIKITRPAVIQLHLVSIELVEDNPDSPLLRLALDYHSSYYADRTVKEVRLQRRADGGMEIVMERNTSVETLPLARLLPTTSVAYNELERSLAANRL